MKRLAYQLIATALVLVPSMAGAAVQLGPGEWVPARVYASSDLAVETGVAEGGTMTFALARGMPLMGGRLVRLKRSLPSYLSKTAT